MEDSPGDSLDSSVIEKGQDIRENISTRVPDEYGDTSGTSGHLGIQFQSQERLEKWILALKQRY